MNLKLAAIGFSLLAILTLQQLSTLIMAKTNRKPPLVVDLAPYKVEIEKHLDKSIAELRRKKPQPVVSLLVIGYSGLSPRVTIDADTEEHSDAIVKKFPDFAGKDSDGRFNNNPADAEYHLAELLFDGFPDLYKLTSPLSLKYPDGKVVAIDFGEEGDEAMNKAMVNFLVPILQEHKGFKELKRASVFRMGVQAQNSVHHKYWRVKDQSR